VSLERVVLGLLEAVEKSNEQVGHYTDVDLLCACGREADLAGDEQDATRVWDLVEHALFDHTTAHDILLERRMRLISSNEMRLVAGYEPATEAEQKWRERQSL
jgi:hypothetical protein